MTPIDIPPVPPPAPPLHAHALPRAVRERQMLRQAVLRAQEAVEAADHAEALAVLATARARHALTHWRERLEAVEQETT